MAGVTIRQIIENDAHIVVYRVICRTMRDVDIERKKVKTRAILELKRADRHDLADWLGQTEVPLGVILHAVEVDWAGSGHQWEIRMRLSDMPLGLLWKYRKMIAGLDTELEPG